MSVYKRGNVWSYKFMFRGELIRRSTKQRNKRVAEQMESAHKTALAKGEMGIAESGPAPTVKEFSCTFMESIETTCAGKPATVEFYRARLRTLLGYRPFAAARIDAINEASIDAYKRRRSQQQTRLGRTCSIATVNRELATLRRMLRLAHEWRVIKRVPRVRLLRGESQRDFILDHEIENAYLDACPDTLADVAILLLDEGLRIGEALTLDWSEIQLEPMRDAEHGFLTVPAKNSKNHKARTLPLTMRVREMLEARGVKDSGLVFQRDGGRSLLVTTLDHQHSRVRKALDLPDDFVLHSLRHTFGTRLGEAGVDAFTIKELMGHGSVVVSQRYVHPTTETMRRAFERMDRRNRSERAKSAG